MEPNYDNPECLQTFHECTEAKKWELFRDQRKAAGDAVAELIRVRVENAELRRILSGIERPILEATDPRLKGTADERE